MDIQLNAPFFWEMSLLQDWVGDLLEFCPFTLSWN